MDLVLVERGELTPRGDETRGDETRGEETRFEESSRNEELEMLCLRFLGDGAGSFMLLGLDGASRLLDTDGDRGDDVMEGDMSSFLLISPTDDERMSPFTGGCSLSIGVWVWDSHGRAAIHRSNQLQPQCGLFGSMNVGFEDFVWFLHICCLYKHKLFRRNLYPIHIRKIENTTN